MRVIIHMGSIGQGAKYLLRALQQIVLGIGGGDESDAQSTRADQQGDQAATLGKRESEFHRCLSVNLDSGKLPDFAPNRSSVHDPFAAEQGDSRGLD